MAKKKVKLVRARRRHALRGRSRRADCDYDCPVKGRQSFGTWVRKGETVTQACERELKRRVDAPQIPLCKKVRTREVD